MLDAVGHNCFRPVIYNTRNQILNLVLTESLILIQYYLNLSQKRMVGGTE